MPFHSFTYIEVVSASLHFLPALNSLLPTGHLHLHDSLPANNTKADPTMLFPADCPHSTDKSPFSGSPGYKLCSLHLLPSPQPPLAFGYQAMLNPPV